MNKTVAKSLLAAVALIALIVMISVMNMTGWFSPKLSGTYSNDDNPYARFTFYFQGNKVTMTGYSSFFDQNPSSSSETFWYKINSDGSISSNSMIINETLRYDKNNDTLIMRGGISNTVYRKK